MFFQYGVLCLVLLDMLDYNFLDVIATCVTDVVKSR